MNKTIELVNQWGAFEEQYPQASIDDFCRHYLAQQQYSKPDGKQVGGVIPPVSNGLLLKIIGRISKLNMYYANQALKGTALNQIEEFGILYTIQQEKNPKKTEVIYANLFELSSGTDMLNRMQKRGLIIEYADADDKRAKRLELTALGVETAEFCKKRILQNAEMIMHDLSEDDKQLCIHLLENVEIKFSEIWQNDKGKDFDRLYQEVTQKGPVQE